jgi:nitrite reductase (NADH) large subunit
MKKVIIIGNGAAGMEAARTIREKNQTVEIYIFTNEPYHFYSRIHLSTFIGDNTSPEDILIYPPSWYADQNIHVLLKTPVLEINPVKNYILDNEGKKYGYDKLIIASGARPIVPLLEGVEKSGIFTLRNLNDALEIRKFIQHCTEAVIVGGGILGIESAFSLNKNSIRVTIVELKNQIMPRQLDKDGSLALQRILEKGGIQFRTSARVQEFKGHPHLNSIVLNNNEEIPAQMAIISAGISPNIELAGKAGIRVNKGILVNENMQTNFNNVYAAGDIAEFKGTIYGIWPAAVDQGSIAAKHLLGIPSDYQGSLPLHILKVAGVELTTFGQINKSRKNDHEIVYDNQEEDKYIKIIHNGSYILGAVVLGMPGIGFRLERLLRQKKPIREYLPYFEKGEWNILRSKK